MKRTMFDLAEELVARVDAVAKREGITRTRAVSVLLDVGLEADGSVDRNRYQPPPTPPPTTEEILDERETPRSMLLGLAANSGRSTIGELGHFANVEMTARYKWSRWLMAQGLLELSRREAWLTDAGWAEARRLGRQRHSGGRAA